MNYLVFSKPNWVPWKNLNLQKHYTKHVSAKKTTTGGFKPQRIENCVHNDSNIYLGKAILCLERRNERRWQDKWLQIIVDCFHQLLAKFKCSDVLLVIFIFQQHLLINVHESIYDWYKKYILHLTLNITGLF